MMLKQIGHFCALIAALVSVAAIGALTTMGNTLNTLFTTVSNSMNTAISG
jgi:pilus assembly protein Flp/PilA